MTRSSQTTRKPFAVVKIGPRGSDYPPSLAAAGFAAPIHAIGDVGLLKLPAMALFCSVKCPGSIIMKTYEAMQRLKLQDQAVTGGFHSPMERTCLDILLRGRVKLILCPARGIQRLRVRPEWRSAITENRVLVISPFDDAVRRSTIALARARNRFVAALAESLFIPYADKKSRTHQFAAEMLADGKSVYTLPDPESQLLLDLGAKVLRV